MNEAAVLCPTGNMCAMTNKELPDCGTKTHLTPDMTADQLCPQALRRAIENERTSYERGNGTMRQRTSSQYRLGSLHFELAGRLVSQDNRAAHYKQADTYMTWVASRSIIRFSGSLSSSIFLVYRNVLLEGASHLPLEETHELQAGLIDLASRVEDPNSRTGQHIRSKLGFHMLFATRGIPALPANARQSGALFEGGRPASAHDFYLIDAESGQTIPHRLSSSGDPTPYTGPCVPADFDAIAMQAMHQLAPGRMTDPVQAGSLGFNLLCDYMEGYEQDKIKVDILQLMGDVALDRAYSFPRPSSSP